MKRECFPSQIAGKKIKWYTEKGNYGKMFNDKIAYLAIAVTDENGYEQLWLNKRYELITSVECEDEQDAFNALVTPIDIKWKRIELGTKQKTTDLSFIFVFIWNQILSILKKSWFVVFIGFVILLFTAGWFPHYGKNVLWYEGVGYSVCLILSILFFVISLLFALRTNRENMLEYICIRVLTGVLLLSVLFMGKGLLDVVLDSFSGTATVYLTETSYRSKSHRYQRANYYLMGEYNGEQYEFNVTGCDRSILYETENSDPEIEVTYYENSWSVVSIKIVEE